ncbi:hypothetical protein [Conexibacter sp. SYSU D00693]|nr:hypothetical protein [Conexibacter sp. SYSU D00693]
MLLGASRRRGQTLRRALGRQRLQLAVGRTRLDDANAGDRLTARWTAGR